MMGVLETEEFASRPVSLAAGDTLLIYTDGLTETRGAGGAMLGDGAVRETYRRNGRAPLEEIEDALFAAASDHGEPHDDQTVILIRA